LAPHALSPEHAKKELSADLGISMTDFVAEIEEQ